MQSTNNSTQLIFIIVYLEIIIQSPLPAQASPSRRNKLKNQPQIQTLPLLLNCCESWPNYIYILGGAQLIMIVLRWIFFVWTVEWFLLLPSTSSLHRDWSLNSENTYSLLKIILHTWISIFYGQVSRHGQQHKTPCTDQETTLKPSLRCHIYVFNSTYAGFTTTSSQPEALMLLSHL